MQSDDLLIRAAEALSWDGSLLVDAELLGDRVDAVVQVPGSGMGSERGDLELVGVLVRRDDWRAARRIAVGFCALTQAAVVVRTASHADRRDAKRLGLGLVVGDVPGVVVQPAPHIERPWTPVHEAIRQEILTAIEATPTARLGAGLAV